MKSSILFVSLAVLLDLVTLASDPQEVASEIREVTVFLRGAQVTRQAGIKLSKGTTTLAFRELPLNIDPQSIQARGEGNFVILSLLHQVNYLASQRKSLQVKALQDSLRKYENRHALNAAMQSVMTHEEDLLIANQQIGGDVKGVLMAELKAAADFYRSRLTEIKKEQLSLARESTRLQEQIERIRSQLKQLQADLNKPTSEILVNVTCVENLAGTLWITYAVTDAGWVPAYDIRAKDIQNPVNLAYNARVSQHTGEDWNRVAIRLSTANPQQRGEKPELQPWYVDFEEEYRVQGEYNVVRSGVAKKSTDGVPLVVEDEMAAAAPEALASTAASFTEISEGQTNLEFNISIPVDIPSDNRQYTLNIQESTLPATYAYYCAPKLDREAFLVAYITDWENLNLLSGEISLFFEGTFVGRSYLNVRNTQDTLGLSLGRDKGIVVTRIKVRDFTEEKTMGSNKRETRAWEITVRNTKKQAIDLHLEDQLPVSMNKDIVVEPIDYSGGHLHPETGRITWKFRMEPSAEKKLRVAFGIKYPKEQRVFID
jgi:uncharacterized protein (TIGR02231 family)